MSTPRRILIGILGGALVLATIGEHIGRRIAQHRYLDAMERRRQLEVQFAEVLATHRQLTANLAREQQRSKELSETVGSMRGQLEESVGQLAEERQTVRQLQVRLTSLQQQLDQLQGELSLALQSATESGTAGGGNAVQLERVVVSDASGSTLAGRVLSVHRDWNFIVVDLGWDAVHVGDTLSIYRSDALLAKARVERVQEGVCAATILPEWETADVRINDQAKVL